MSVLRECGRVDARRQLPLWTKPRRLDDRRSSACFRGEAGSQPRLDRPACRAGQEPRLDRTWTSSSGRAIETVLTGRPYPAATFAEWGVVNRVLPDAELDEKTLAFAPGDSPSSPDGQKRTTLDKRCTELLMSLRYKKEPTKGLEPLTPALPWRCSTS